MMLKNTMIAAFGTEDKAFDYQYCNNSSQHGYNSEDDDYDRICRDLRVYIFVSSAKYKENRVILWRHGLAC